MPPFAAVAIQVLTAGKLAAGKLAASYRESSPAWRLQKFQQRLAEWWEWRTRNFAPDAPDWSLPDWLTGLTASVLARLAFWVVVAALLCWLAVALLRAGRAAWRSRRRRAIAGPARQEPLHSARHWLQEAVRQRERGNYREACLCWYRALLQRLDETGAVPARAGRTDGEYGQLLRSRGLSKGESPGAEASDPLARLSARSRQACQQLLAIHERICFGGFAPTAETADRCQRAYQEVEAP